jgi:hypothetical protein
MYGLFSLKAAAEGTAKWKQLVTLNIWVALLQCFNKRPRRLRLPLS